MRKSLIAVPLAIVAIGLLWWSQRRTGPFFVSGIIESDEIRVGSRVGGRVAEVPAVEGQSVKAGATLVALDPYDLNERLAQVRATLAAQQRILEKRRAGNRPEEIEQARARRDRWKATLDQLIAGPRPLDIQIRKDMVASAKAELARAESEYERIKALGQPERATKELVDATAALGIARAKLEQVQHELALLEEGTRAEEKAQGQANLAEAQAALALLEKGFRAEDIAEAESNVAASEAAVAMIQRQLTELAVVAPTDAVVEAVDLRPGDIIAPSAPVITLIDPTRLWVRAYVPENRIDLKVNQKVSVAIDAFPGRRFAGHITFVARHAEFTPANIQTPEERSKQVFRVKVELDEGRERLRPGMSADVYLEHGT